MKFLLWSIDQAMYWGPVMGQFTPSVSEALRLSRELAQTVSRSMLPVRQADDKGGWKSPDLIVVLAPESLEGAMTQAAKIAELWTKQHELVHLLTNAEEDLAEKVAIINGLKQQLGRFAGAWLQSFLQEIEKPENDWMLEYFKASGDLDDLARAFEKARGRK